MVRSTTRTTDFPDIDYRQKTTQPSQRIFSTCRDLHVCTLDLNLVDADTCRGFKRKSSKGLKVGMFYTTAV